MLIAGLGSTCSVLGGETDCRKASDGMCIVRWRVTTAVIDWLVAGERNESEARSAIRSATNCVTSCHASS